jgi:hypothetical protein
MFLGLLWLIGRLFNPTPQPPRRQHHRTKTPRRAHDLYAYDRRERLHQRRRAVQPQWDENTFEPPWLYDDYLERPEEYEDWQ